MSKDSKMRIPPTPFERMADQFQQAIDTYDKIVREKTVVENLERFDVARDLVLVSDHLRIARLLLVEALRKAAGPNTNGELSV